MNNEELKVLLQDEELQRCFHCLQTDDCKKLTDIELVKVFQTISDKFCDFYKVKRQKVVMSEDKIDKEDFDDGGHRTIQEDEEKIVINDIDDNQYLILYDLLFSFRENMLFDAFISNKEIKLSKKIYEELDKQVNIESFNKYFVDYYIIKGRSLANYQAVSIEARNFASAILFKIIRSNYSSASSYDEQEFMSNMRILESGELLRLGGKALRKREFKYDDIEKDIIYFNKLAQRINESIDLSTFKDSEILPFLYPGIVEALNQKAIRNLLVEVSRRLKIKNLSVELIDKDFLINGKRVSSEKAYSNLIDVLFMECMRCIDADNQENMFLKKKQWLYEAISYIDTKIGMKNNSYIKYQPLIRLLNIKKLSSKIEGTKKGGSR